MDKANSNGALLQNKDKLYIGAKYMRDRMPNCQDTKLLRYPARKDIEFYLRPDTG